MLTRGGIRRSRRLARRGFLAGAAAAPFLIAWRTARGEPGAPFFDMHAHPVVNLRGQAMPPAASLVSAMDARGIQRTVLSPPPTTRDGAHAGTYGPAELAALVGQAPGRLAFAGGGDTLNPLLQRTPAAAVSAELLDVFRQTAREIAAAGAVAFAELGAEVLPAGKGMPGGHDHQTTPADHPMLLALADVAAEFAMPIALHMEAITSGLGQPENLSAMERLLAHNRKTRIVWLHAGWDRTGERSVELMQPLLQRNPNLFMTIKSDRLGDPANSPLGGTGRLQPDWLAMLQAFPDRFVIGSDQFYDRDLDRIDATRRIVDAMPTDLAHQIGLVNPARVYRLPA